MKRLIGFQDQQDSIRLLPCCLICLKLNWADQTNRQLGYLDLCLYNKALYSLFDISFGESTLSCTCISCFWTVWFICTISNTERLTKFTLLVKDNTNSDEIAESDLRLFFTYNLQVTFSFDLFYIFILNLNSYTVYTLSFSGVKFQFTLSNSN